MADILVRAAKDTVVVVDVETTSFLDENFAQWRPSQIATAQGVTCVVHPFGVLGDGVTGLSDEALVMRREDLPGFLSDWSPYELTLVGLLDRPNTDRLDEIAVALGASRHDHPVLSAISGACLWYSGYDDCYVSVHTTDRTIPVAIFGRLLALLAGSALADIAPVEVPDPDHVVVEALRDDSRHWVGALGSTPNAVTIALSATSGQWRMGHPLPQRIDRTAVYDVTDGRWHLETVSR
ncbi:hypothetical protein ACQSSU_19965 [Micromonospora echinospora]